MEDRRWIDLMAGFNFSPNQSTYAKLIDAYSEKHRFYHDVSHLQSVLKQLDKNKNFAKRSHEVELALWFHDAVYNPLSKKNELESAKWASTFLSLNKAVDDTVDRVFELIMATCHNSQVDTQDQKLMIDIDLSILGSTQEDYKKYEEKVRKEYRFVPTFIFKRKRMQILESFLEKERIFQTISFFELYENKARLNLKREIQFLRNQG